MNFDEKSYVANCYKNIGEIYFSQKNFEKALEYLNKSLKIIEEIGDKHGIAVCFLSIGKIHGELRNALLSQSFNSKSLKIAREIGAKEIEMKALQNLSDQEFTLGNYAAALDYFKKHSVIKDTILGIETRKQIAEFQTKYDTEKKEQENIKLRMKNELQEQTIQKQIYASILVTVFLISAAILAIVFFRGQKKQKKLIFYLHKRMNKSIQH
jgi:tetratricopeptide (TPR) repeat protein